MAMSDATRRLGLVPLPLDLQPTDKRKAREDAALGEIEARLANGSLSPEDADRMILEMVLKERFAFLPADAAEELRIAGLALLDEPELVETREALARDGDES